eukprot:gene35843-46526_t
MILAANTRVHRPRENALQDISGCFGAGGRETRAAHLPRTEPHENNQQQNQRLDAMGMADYYPDRAVSVTVDEAPLTMGLESFEEKAVDGSPVCFYCPTCRSSDSIKGLKSDVGASNLRRVNAFDRERVISLLLQTVAASDERRQDLQQVLRKKKKTNTMVIGVQVEEKEQYSHRIGGQDTTPRCANYDHISDWSNKVELTCSRGHTWAASVVNVVYGRTWCRRCQQQDRSLSEQDFHITAERMGGTFLGFSSPTNPDSKGRLSLYRQKATWRCGRGHVFEQQCKALFVVSLMQEGASGG